MIATWYTVLFKQLIFIQFLETFSDIMEFKDHFHIHKIQLLDFLSAESFKWKLI
jgi:hypothetical protein